MLQRIRRRYRGLAINQKINLFVLIITLLTVTLFGLFSYLSFQGTAVRIIGEDALKISDTVAAQINGDQIEQYAKTSEADASWNQLTGLLSRIKAKNGADFIYIMADDGDKYKYIAEGHVDGRTDDVTKLGDTDEKSIFPEEPQTALRTGRDVYSDIYANGSYGKLISGFTPIQNSDGKTVAVLGVDISANSAVASINQYIPELIVFLLFFEIVLVLMLRLLLRRMVIRPLKELTALEGTIAQGIPDVRIDPKYLEQKDEIGELFQGFQSMSGTYRAMLENIEDMAQQHRQGNTDVFIDENRYQGIYREVVSGVNEMARDYLKDLSVVIGYLDNISGGDFEAELARFPGRKAFINDKIDLLKSNLKNITSQMNRLVTSAIAGDLHSRAQAEGFSGDWQRLMQLLNELLDAVVEPVLETSAVLNQLADGNTEIRISGEYRGSFGQIKTSLNRLSGVVGEMTRDVGRLAAATIDGNLAVRADAGRYSGEYRNIMESMNRTMDAVQIPLEQITSQLDRMADGLRTEPLEEKFKGIYADLAVSTNALGGSISAMFRQANELMLAARKGDLEVRASTGELRGEYADIIESINHAMDAVVLPIGEISGVVQEIARGNLHRKVEGEYQGSILRLKENVNHTVDTLNDVIQDITRYTEEIASGSLNMDPLPGYGGDFDKISASLNEIVLSLNGAFQTIRKSSEKISGESRQMDEGSRVLSEGAAEQSSSVEQLTASIGEISSQTEENARNAENAGKLANTARMEAEAGDAKMKELLRAMEGISEASRNIVRIIKTIDDLAFQTNILALNAAVEAARAGQHGKGFAVVADEVRNLANKSAKAAMETGELIAQAGAKVSEGSALADEMAKSLNVMNETVGTVDRLLTSIMQASREQAAGIGQINSGIEVVSDVVQRNAAASEESAALSGELSDQAERLMETICRFRLKEL